MSNGAPKKLSSLAQVCLVGGMAATSAGVVVTGTWISVFLFIPFLIALRRLGSRAGWRAALWLNPLTLAAAWAVATYACGTARLWSHGLPGPPCLDRYTRLAVRFRGGCRVEGPDIFIDGVHNLALSACTALLGPMWSAPHGPYPEQKELAGGWEGAEKLKVEDLFAGNVVVHGVKREIERPERLLNLILYGGMNPQDPQECGKVEVQARDFGSGTFAIRLTEKGIPAKEGLGAIALYGGSRPRFFEAIQVPETRGMNAVAARGLR